MKFIYLILICTSLSLNAQIEIKNKSKTFPIAGNVFHAPLKPKPTIPDKISPFAKDETLSKLPPIYSPNNSFPETKPSSSFEIRTKKEIDLANQSSFANPNEGLLDKLNKKSGGEVSDGFKLIRGNQDLGSFNSKSNFVNVKYRDFGEIDGDQIRIYVNDKIVVNDATLSSDYQGFKIDLIKGFNKVEFEALNQGTLGPNTADFQVYDDQGKLVSANRWNLATGFRASIMVFKE
jgi:hypothetical protein